MTLADAILLFVAGFLSGVVNAIAGGGTFLTFGAMTLTGLPPIVANATSSITQFPGYVTSTLAYAKEIRADWKEAAILGTLSLVGGLAGALLLLSLSNPSFRALVPWLLLAATAIFAAGPYLKPKTLHAEKPVSPLGLAGQFVTSIYGGFFGAGMGIMMLAALAIIGSGNYHEDNAVKNVVAFLIQIVSAGLLIAGGLVHWPQALVTIVASVIGGYWGVSVARNVPVKVIRATVVLVGAVLTVIFFIKG